MAAAANDRLGSLRVERAQAIEDIQRGLATLGLYTGDIDGRGGEGTMRAVRQFSNQYRQSAPTIATAAPRDLRGLAEAIERVAASRSSAPTATLAAATTPAPAATPAANAAAEADRLRIAQAQAAAQTATQVAATQAARPEQDADSLATLQLRRIADAEEWARAEGANTVTGYQAYLAAHPTGAQANAARAEITTLNKPAPFSIDSLPNDLKSAAEAARRVQAIANARAAAARDSAARADAAPGRASIVAAGGDSYDAQISGGAPNGLGARVSGNVTNAGDRYRGQLSNGQSDGVGVYEFADNPGNAAAGALRYEGEHEDDAAGGLGVTYWRNGDRFSGEARPDGTSRGVLTFANGQRYEGDLRDGNRNGFGIVWSADGTVVMAGRWANGELVEPIKPAQ
jgi:peptidoglycan hydrolase-like protein with peptidoglycan-binding domain